MPTIQTDRVAPKQLKDVPSGALFTKGGGVHLMQKSGRYFVSLETGQSYKTATRALEAIDEVLPAGTKVTLVA